MTKIQPRIAIFYPFPGLAGAHYLRGAAELMAERGYQVDIYTQGRERYPSALFRTGAIREIVDHPGVVEDAPVRVPAWADGVLRRYYRGLVARILRPAWRRFVFPRQLRKKRTAGYVCAVGMDDRGIIAAGPIANVLNIPLVYWNLELRFLDEATDSAAVRRKRQEIRWCKQAVLTISQDRWRAKALAEENGLDETQIALVPIASLGAAQRRRSNYLRARLGIAQGRKIVLCTGGFAWWTHTLEIVRAAPTWPMDYVLVVHSLTRKTDVTDYMKLVTDSADGVHSIVSFDPVSSEDYQNVVDSADIGLAWYHIWDPVSHRLNKNMLFMGHSSGKLADYLKSGLPVVVNKSLGPSELIEEYRCGISVQEPGQLGTALRRILDEYDSCAANAVRCFNERLELRRNFTKVLDRIEAAIQPALQRVRSDASPAMRVHL